MGWVEHIKWRTRWRSDLKSSQGRETGLTHFHTFQMRFDFEFLNRWIREVTIAFFHKLSTLLHSLCKQSMNRYSRSYTLQKFSESSQRIQTYIYTIIKYNSLGFLCNIMGVVQWTFTSLAPSEHWIWVYSYWILDLRRAPVMSMFIEGLSLFLFISL